MSPFYDPPGLLVTIPDCKMAGGAIDHSEHSEPTTVSDELDALLTTNGDESSLTNGTAAAAHDISNNNFVQTKCPYCQGHKVLKRYYYRQRKL